MPEGEKVCAARSGQVVELKKDSDKGGFDKKFLNDCNFVRIEHGDGTVAMYGHLQKDGVLVALGDLVFAGQPIGLSGHTGFASGPHLHFEVNRGVKTIPFRHAEFSGEPVEGRKYTSKNKLSDLAERRAEFFAADKAAKLALQYEQFTLAVPSLKKLADVSDDAGLFVKARAKLKEIEEEGTRLVARIEHELDSNNIEEAAELALLGRLAHHGQPAEPRLKELEVKILETMGRRADRVKLVHSQLLIFQEGLRLEMKDKKEEAKKYYSIVAESEIQSHVVHWAKDRLK